MAIAILTIADIALLFMAAAWVFASRDIVKTAALAVSSFCFLYVIACGLLFLMDAFSFERALTGVLACAAACAAYCLGRARRRGSLRKCFEGGWRIEPAPAVLALLSLLLTFGKFEMYHNGQDQGAYQTAAIQLYAGDYKLTHHFEEYQILEKEEDREAYIQMLLDAGSYSLTGEKSATYGFYHGVHTYSATLALAGRLFGLQNMMQAQTVFFVCAVVLLYYALKNTGLSQAKTIGALFPLMLSPLVLWVSKASLTEMLLTLCVCAYLFLLTKRDTAAGRGLSAFPLAAFSYVHISFLILYPAFVLSYVLLYMKERKREYLWANVATAVALSTGYITISSIAPVYFYGNIPRLFVGKIITQSNVLCWVFAGAAVCAFAPLLLLRMRDTPALYDKLLTVRKAAPVLVSVCVAFVLVRSVYIGYFAERSEGGEPQWWSSGFAKAIGHSTLFTYAMATGFAAFCVILLGLVFMNRERLWASAGKTVVWCLLLYSVFLQSVVLRRDVGYHYYYGRYLILYIPIICMAFGILLEEMKRILPALAVCVSVASMLVFDVPLLKNKDLSVFDWENFLDLKEVIQENSAIIMPAHFAKYIGFQLRAVTGSALFPVFDDVGEEIALLKERYTNVYFLHQIDGNVPEGIINSPYLLVYKDRNHYDDVWITDDWHFPLEYPKDQRATELLLL